MHDHDTIYDTPAGRKTRVYTQMKDLKDLCRNVCRNWTYRVSNAGAVFLNVVLMLKDFRLFWCHLWFVVVTEAEEQLVFMCF